MHTMSGALLEVEPLQKQTPLLHEAHIEGKMNKTSSSCGTKRISKLKCAKHTMFGTLLEVEFLKKCTPLCLEAHVEVKMYKTHHVWSTFGS